MICRACWGLITSSRQSRRTRWRSFAACGLWSVVLTISVLHRSEAQRPSPEMLHDAELTDVFFVDPERGWAIGDRGVILYTDNGGQHWHPQASGVACRLTSIHFVDPHNGWIVGGWSHPYTSKTSGVVLRTRDGGRHWQVVRGPTLPALKMVKFFDARNGWAIGNPSAMYPAGVFRTNDGGRSWSSMPASNNNSWLTGDFRDMHIGAVAGRAGAMGLVRNVRLDPARMAGVGARDLRRMKLLGPTNGWLVGDGGLVFQTQDGGLTWQAPPGSIPPELRTQADFRAVATVGPHCWIGGSPGSLIYHTNDYGRNWHLLRTNQSLPLNGLHFVNESRGWAVGALGTILFTNDGGRTWIRQRSGGTRLAMLGVFSDAKRVPWELFTKLSGNEGYLSGIEFLTRPTNEAARLEATLSEKNHQALLATGGSVTDQEYRFPVRDEAIRLSDAAIVAGWDANNDGRSMMFMERHLVRKIRQWRPEVLLTESDSRGSSGLSSVISRTTLSAVAKAADPTAYPEQIQGHGLRPWTVKKVYGVLPSGSRASLEISTSDLAVRLGRTLAGQASIGRAIVTDTYTPAPQRIPLRLLLNKLNEQVGKHDIFTGIPLAYGGEARRRLETATNGDASAIVRAAQKRRNLEQLFTRASRQRQGGTNWLAQMKDLTDGLSDIQAGEVLNQLATQMHAKGQSELAADIFQQLVDQYPDHPLTESVIVWLIQYYSSGEILWRQRARTRVTTQHAAGTTKPGQKRVAKQVSFIAPIEPTPMRFAKTGRNRTAFSGLKPGDRHGRAIALGRSVEGTRPSLHAEPRLRFPLGAALRAHGYTRDAEKFFQNTVRSRQQDAWWQCAQSELWMNHGRGLPSKPVANCKGIAEKPYLDGKLDDNTWNDAEKLTLKSALRDDEQWPAVAMICRDGEFLYLAVACKKAPQSRYDKSPESRQRDADQKDHDRVDFLIDIDRDYGSYYRFTVDHRGWGSDACFGDTSWDPKWSIAHSEDGSSWTAEMAIPLKELSGVPPTSRAVWAMGIQRVAPGSGFQSWTAPARPTRAAEGFGLLVFE